MKRLSSILILISIFLLPGCLASKIKINNYIESKLEHGYKDNYNFEITDSLEKIFELEITGSFHNQSIVFNKKFGFINDLSGVIFCFDFDKQKFLGKVKGEGPIYTSPILFKDFLIFIDVEGKENKSYLNFYNVRTGDTEFRREFDGIVENEIIADSSFLYFNTVNGIVYKYDIYGMQVWRTDTKIQIHSSLAAAKDYLFFGNDKGEIINIEKSNGKINYRKKIASVFESLITVNGEMAYTPNSDKNIYVINIKDGSIDRKIKLNEEVYSNPYIENNNIYINTLEGNLYSLSLNGEIKWKVNLGGLLNITMTSTKNLLIVPDANKKIFFINKLTGNVQKVIELPARASLPAIIYRDKYLITGYERGVLVIYEFIK